MDQQAGPSAARRLLDLPLSCLHHIVSFMDKQTKLQLFRASKGSQEVPGCAVLVLRASNPQCIYNVQPQGISPRPAFCSLLHWASQISVDVQLTVIPEVRGAGFQLLDVLHSLLLYPAARVTPSGRVLGRPATYPGITSLKLEVYKCSCLIPGLVADAFPNLKSFTATWTPDESQPLGPVLQRELSSWQRMQVTLSVYIIDELRPAARQHIAQQLSLMPSVTSIGVDNDVFRAVPASILAKLKVLQLWVHSDATAEDKAALTACSQLESLALHGVPGGWVQALPQLVPSIRSLDASILMTDQHMPALLGLHHVTSLTVGCLCRLSDDYSVARCNWKHFECRLSCSSDITKLPLHALDSLVQCRQFSLTLSDHAADLAAIRAAKPHLLRCGGIDMGCGTLNVDFSDDSAITEQEVAEVLEEWATCLSVPQRILCHVNWKPVIEDAVARLWPAAMFEGWEDSDEDEAIGRIGSDEEAYELGGFDEGAYGWLGSEEAADEWEGSDEAADEWEGSDGW